jgi:hypothetical protein
MTGNGTKEPRESKKSINNADYEGDIGRIIGVVVGVIGIILFMLFVFYLAGVF